MREALTVAKTSGSWKQKQISAFIYLYRPAAERWNAEGHSDDRRVYCNTYRLILAGLRSLPAEPPLYIRNAVNDAMRRVRATLDRIAARFEKREVGRG